jgi:hypothetical protein
MQAKAKGAFARGEALAWMAGLGFTLFAVVAPARAEIAFTPERATLACPDAPAEALKGQGNALLVPGKTAEQLKGCAIVIQFAVRDPALAERAAAEGQVELVGLKRVKPSFPVRLPVNRDGVTLAALPGGGLTLSLAAETIFAGDRARGAALILAWRTGDGDAARAYLSPTLLIERADSALLRAKRASN